MGTLDYDGMKYPDTYDEKEEQIIKTYRQELEIYNFLKNLKIESCICRGDYIKFFDVTKENIVVVSDSDDNEDKFYVVYDDDWL